MIHPKILDRLELLGEEERLHVLPLVRRMVDTSAIARKEGLLALEGRFDGEDFFTRKAFRLVVDGYAPEVIGEILDNYILSDQTSGTELLERVLIREAALRIFTGVNPSEMRELLLSVAGSLAAGEYEKGENEDEEEGGAIERWLKREAAKSYLSEETSLLEKPFLTAADAVIRAVAEKTLLNGVLLLALRGSSGKVLERVVRCLGPAGALTVKEEMESDGPVRTSSIVDAQKKVLAVLEGIPRS